MDVGHFFSLVAEACFFATSLALAFTVMRARAEEDEELPSRLFRTTQRMAVFVWLPTLLGVLWVLFNDGRAHRNSGIMSGQMAFVVLFTLGALALMMVWVSTVVLAFISASLVRQSRPLPALAVGFMALQRLSPR